MIDVLLFLGSGKILLFFMRKFPPIRAVMSKWELSQKLFDCDLCLGFWVFLFLSPWFDIDVKQINNKVLRWIVTACLSSFLSYLISVGWEQEYGTVVIEDHA